MCESESMEVWRLNISLSFPEIICSLEYLHEAGMVLAEIPKDKSITILTPDLRVLSPPYISLPP